MDRKKIIIAFTGLDGKSTPGVITLPNACAGVLLDEESVSWEDGMDDEKQRGITLSREDNKPTSFTISCDISISDKIKLLQKAAQAFGRTLNDLKQAIERLQMYESFNSDIKDALSKLKCEYDDLATQDCADLNFDISERKRDQKKCYEFHNAIYGSKFRQAKHSSKQAHTALKQNTRRIRNNGMIKHRIQNYNKPVTM